jgi:hypothetical protein
MDAQESSSRTEATPKAASNNAIAPRSIRGDIVAYSSFERLEDDRVSRTMPASKIATLNHAVQQAAE